MKRKLVFVTNNLHKLGEIRNVEGLNIEVLSLKDIGFKGDIPEDYDTLRENAMQKARFIYDRYGLDCFADDTGLEVDALGGRPGVLSARYAGPQCNADDNIEKLLLELRGKALRTARFRTVIALIMDGKEHFFEGTVEGEILSEKRGGDGFGYDPVFLVHNSSRTAAELTAEEKNRISHRGKAAAAAARILAAMDTN